MKQKKIMIIATLVVFALILSLNYVRTNVYSRALIKAIEKDDMKRLEVLLKKPGDVNATPFYSLFLFDRLNNVPLSEASRLGNYDAVKLLVEAGANVNKDSAGGWPPLVSALQNSNDNTYQIVNYLLDQGANPKVNSGRGFQNTVIERTFFSNTSEEEAYKLFKRFLKMGVPIESERYYGNNVVFSAAFNNNVLVLKYLIEEKNIDMNRKSEFKDTPLMLAAKGDAIDAVKYLLSQGADKTVKDEDGMTAYDYAVENKNQKMMDLLKIE